MAQMYPDFHLVTIAEKSALLLTVRGLSPPGLRMKGQAMSILSHKK